MYSIKKLELNIVSKIFIVEYKNILITKPYVYQSKHSHTKYIEKCSHNYPFLSRFFLTDFTVSER